MNGLLILEERNNNMQVKDSHFLKSYRNQVLDVILKKHPDIPKEKAKEIVDSILMRELRNPPAEIENTYTHEKKDTTLLSVLDFAIETKPIIAANATFFKQHAVSKNPNALMVDEFLISRKKTKNKMFSIEDEVDRMYKMLDLKQGNFKRLANSYYGGSGMKASPFYNKHTAPCTTKSAQSVISTCETTFEAFLVSNFSFVDINECYYWISVVLNEEDKEVDSWVKRKTLDECYERLSRVVIGATDEDKDGLYEYLSTLSEDDWTRLYWKNNLIEFTDKHQVIKDLHDLIFSSIRNYEYMEDENDFGKVPDEFLERVKNAKKPMKEWENIVDHEYFYDPNDVPESIEEPLRILKDFYMKYIYVRYLYTDRIYKLKNFQRSVVTVIDTDSNILSLDTWMDYCISDLMRGDYGRSEWNNIFIAINTAAYIITSVVTDVLLFYGLMSNVEEKYRPRYSMKNEFFFSNLVLAKVKKRYLSKVILREGHRLTKPKYDIKGYDFKKASTSDDASKFFMHVVKDLILEPENIDLKVIMTEIQRFREEVRISLEEGDRKYLPMGNAKELEAYAEPKSEQSVRGAMAWNLIYPDHAVELPVKLSILKTNIYEESDIADLKNKDPELYQRIVDNIFNDKTGFFNKKAGKDGKIKREGLSVIGIPLHEKIPDWIIPYIDYQTVINSVLSPFKSVTDTFNLPSIEEGKTGRKTTGFSNIIRI